MKKHLLIYLFCILMYNSIIAQTFYKPNFEDKSLLNTYIQKIELTEKYTIVEIKCVNRSVYGSLVCINEKSYIKEQQNSKKYGFIKAEHIPKCPFEYELNNYGESLTFKLYFEPLKLSNTINKIDIIEDNSIENGFNFWGVELIFRV